MFEAEADGLRELRAADAVRVPEVFDCGIADGESFIEIERLDLERPTRAIEQAFGEQLAALHRHTADQFGWYRDNTIGPTPQINEQSNDWVGFFRVHRLGYQLLLADANGYGNEVSSLGRKLSEGLEKLFVDYVPEASLLHGDLWGGNWGAVGGEAVIFDPAVYYGDRESDIAMTKLFGGFGSAFYDAYMASWPLAAGWENRLKLYQLYHVLNHLNLFGRSYLGQAQSQLRELAGIV